MASVEKILSDGRRIVTKYNEQGVKTLYEEYAGSAQLLIRNSWEYYENGKIYRSVEEAWREDGSLRKRIDTRYSTFDALFDRRSITEDEPDREIYESFDDSNRLLYKQISKLDGSFIRSFETVYYFHSNQPETEEEIWMEDGAQRIVKRTYDPDGILLQVYEQFADGSTLTESFMSWGDPESRIWQDADGFVTEEQNYFYYFASENLNYMEDRLWMEDEQGYELTRFDFAESGELIFEGVRYADGSGDYTWKDLQGHVTATEKYYANGVQESGSTYEFHENSDICSRETDIEWDENGNMIYYGEADFFTDGSLKRSYSLYQNRERCWEYNLQGELVKYTCREDEVLRRQEKYVYSVDGTRLLTEDIQAWNQDGSVDFREINEYYDNGKKSSHRYLYADGSWELHGFDEQGRWLLQREVRPSGSVAREKTWDYDTGEIRERRWFDDGFLKSELYWVRGDLRLRTEYYDNHVLRLKQTVNADGTGEIREYDENGKLTWSEKTTKDWILERSYKNGRQTYERYTDRSGGFLSQTIWQYYTEGGKNMVRIDVTHADMTVTTLITEDDGKIGYKIE